jgi:F-type H+-transporting ATPase subunit epsilon
MSTLILKLITQERILIEEPAVSVTLPSEDGEITILHGHTNLFTKISPGIITVKTPQGAEDKLVTVGGGFADISADEIKILADTAVRADEIDEAKVEQAKKAAEEAMKNKDDRQKFLEAESALRKALLELETSRKWKKLRHGSTT